MKSEQFFFTFYFYCVYEMVGSKTLKISIGEIIKDPEMLRLFPFILIAK